MQKHSMALLAALSALTIGGCVDLPPSEYEVVVEGNDEDGALFEGAAEELQEMLAVEDGHAVSPLISIPTSATRVAFRFDASESILVDFRMQTGDVLTEWIPTQQTYQDEIANNGHADVPAGTEAVQLRFRTSVGTVQALIVEAFTFNPDAPSEDADIVSSNIGAEQMGVETQALVRDRLPSSMYVSRSAWGARARSCTGTHSPARLTVHHTVTPNNDGMSMPARMRQIQSYHIDSRGWCDVGYHFLIGQDGKVYQGRMEKTIGAHAAGANTNNVGISFIGDYMTRSPTAAQRTAAANVMAAMHREYGFTLNRTNVQGHRQVGSTSTSCPGDELYGQLTTIINEAKDIVGGNNTPPPAEPPSTPPPPATGSYADLGNNHAAYAAAEALRDAGALWGCDVGQFCPDQEITRAEVAYMLAVLDTENYSSGDAPSISDVGAADRDEVREVLAKGFMRTCSTGSFCPEGTVSRAGMALFLTRSKRLTSLESAQPTFNDVDSSHWAYGAIERMASINVFAGCRASPRAYCPADNMSRASAAIVVARAYNMIPR
jgi:hypothetical protein